MLSINISKKRIEGVRNKILQFPIERYIVLCVSTISILATLYFFKHDALVTYGDSESHLNIAKRVADSLTPGFAQLGGIWLPLPHLMLVPFVHFDFLWRTGLAGSIVSGFSFVVTALYLYKIVLLITKNKAASLLAVLVATLNPNMLYFQSTPMTELPLIMFFTLSSYYFIKYLYDDNSLKDLIAAAIFGFLATATRYDGWFLVGIEAAIIGLKFLPWNNIPKKITEIKNGFENSKWEKMQGHLMIFVTLAFFAICLWLLWDFLILGDPLYFTNSEFSAKSQQNAFLAGGMLPGYHHLFTSVLYYFVTSLSNVGLMVFLASLAGFFTYIFNKKESYRLYIGIILSIIFVFNVFTMYVGQSVIFIPSLTPSSFGNNLFNVRYGLLMVPFSSIFFAYMFFRSKQFGKLLLLGLLPLQLALYVVGYSTVITLQDGRTGVSSAARPEAERWMKQHYDGGLVLLDDYARTISIVRSGIPMQKMIYVGNKPYWAESLKEPEKYATWIAMREHDALWKAIYLEPEIKDRLYANFDLVYTEKDIMIFKKKNTGSVSK